LNSSMVTGRPHVERYFLRSAMEFSPSGMMPPSVGLYYWLVTSTSRCRMAPLQTEPQTLRILVSLLLSVDDFSISLSTLFVGMLFKHFDQSRMSFCRNIPSDRPFVMHFLVWTSV
jgi:hypothetical protein